MKVDDFGIRQECVTALRRTGIEEVEELVEFLENYQHGTKIRAEWLKCFEEIQYQIKLLGLWSSELERKWPSI